MTGALCAWRDGVADQLRKNGLNAVTAMDCQQAPRWREAVTAVALSKVTCAPGGFQNYLGVQKGTDGEEWEVYGQEAELTLALDIFAPRDGGGEACQQAVDAVLEALVCQGAAGLTALEVRTDRVQFLEKDGLYRQELLCRCGAWLTARVDSETGFFTDFEVKGRVT